MAAAEGEGSTQPVREQLKKASLDNGVGGTHAKTNDDSAPKPLSKKRSHESIIDGEDEDMQTRTAAHTRKRSRDSTAEVEEPEVKKRASSEAKRETQNDRPTTPEADTVIAEEVASPKTKKSRLQEQEGTTEDKAKLGGGFANTSATSPFGAMSAKPSDTQQTSASAFAASGFSALSKSSTSGFGAVGKSSGGLSSFASKPAAAADSEKKDDAPKSVFGGSLGAKSAFSASTNGTTSGFGSGFGSSGGLGAAFANKGGFGALGGGKGLTSFASNKSTSAFAAKPAAKTTTDDGDENGEENGDAAAEAGIKSPKSVGLDEDKKDDRFYEQAVETGEEDERTIFSARAKLYTYGVNEDGDKAWKERGVGVIKLNTKRPAESEEAGTQTTEGSLARLVMRADGSHRLVLNSHITKDITVQRPGKDGGPPDRGVLMFMGTTSGGSKLETLQLKLRNEFAVNLYDKVAELQAAARSGSV